MEFTRPASNYLIKIIEGKFSVMDSSRTPILKATVQNFCHHKNRQLSIGEFLLQQKWYHLGLSGQPTNSMQKISDIKSDVLGATVKITTGHGRKATTNHTPVVTIPSQKNQGSLATQAFSFISNFLSTQPDEPQP
jgi:hypothetical protein